MEHYYPNYYLLLSNYLKERNEIRQKDQINNNYEEKSKIIGSSGITHKSLVKDTTLGDLKKLLNNGNITKEQFNDIKNEKIQGSEVLTHFNK